MTSPRIQETPAEQREHVQRLLEGVSVVMFATFVSTQLTPDVKARPLTVARVEGDGVMWFIVPRDSEIVEQLERVASSYVTAQSAMRYLHLSGAATVVDDRAKLREVWSRMNDVWFPQGPDDPHATLVRFAPDSAEYWDSSGLNGLRFAYAAAKALITNEPPEPQPGLHGEVRAR